MWSMNSSSVGLGDALTKAGKPTMPIRPPVAAAALIWSSAMLRGESFTAFAFECEKTTGRVDASIASIVVR